MAASTVAKSTTAKSTVEKSTMMLPTVANKNPTIPLRRPLTSFDRLDYKGVSGDREKSHKYSRCPALGSKLFTRK
jgi:hypothetical protein